MLIVKNVLTLFNLDSREYFFQIDENQSFGRNFLHNCFFKSSSSSSVCRRVSSFSLVSPIFKTIKDAYQC
ncbi:hypothetical protein HanXRQr2_Chr15g0712361 [Helianthus annuus]|uniref:Uncharacterized protein n=1 Tax=Helianthus annuus TaxID=4232 RepID=A0A9K3E4F1_HELAN|nr:hypothetical protein HanXRQr2_Chr15g0712361 [Helianthus annuus]KAJ0832877.1 hypothetical protein HanPSC8_Chr15g0683731 [Helianthus annuus]